MKTVLASLIAIVVLAWAQGVILGAPLTGAPLWILRQHGLHLSGLLAIAMLSLATLLASRPLWLEGPLGGMDRIFRTHKWAGILAGVFSAAHWLIELSGGLLKATIGRQGRVPKEKLAGALDGLQHLAKDMGEWAVYALLAMLAIALWQRFPYRPWRVLHRAMPVLYLMLAFHTALLAPTAYWTQPAGLLIAALLAAGVYGSVRSLTGRIGRARQTPGQIVAIDRSSPAVLGVRLRLENGWPGHRPGQFAFVSFERGEGPHPFTIAGTDRGDRELPFQIKALGDYTATLGQRLHVGQAVTVEGPYGRFDIARHDRQARQIWIAGGIGVTPFLAWLESLQENPADAPAAELHYCTRDRENDPFAARLRTLSDKLPGIRLHVHGSRQGEHLRAEQLTDSEERSRLVEIWFCGPQGLAQSLRAGLRTRWRGRLRFHQEAFAMR